MRATAVTRACWVVGRSGEKSRWLESGQRRRGTLLALVLFLVAAELGPVRLLVGEDGHSEVLGHGVVGVLRGRDEGAVGGDGVLLGVEDALDDREDVGGVFRRLE